MLLAKDKVRDFLGLDPFYLITNNKVLIHIDVDPAEIGKQVGPHIPLVGDIKHIFEDMKNDSFDNNFSEWVNTLYSYKEKAPKRKAPSADYVDPAEFIRLLSEKMDEDSVYVADVGQNQMWSCNYYVCQDGKFLTMDIEKVMKDAKESADYLLKG